MSAVALTVAACDVPRAPPPTVSDLMEDRVTLDGVLIKCNRDPAVADSGADCLNARVAVERLAALQEKVEAAKRSEEFEHSREQLRLAEDMQRKRQEESTKVDPYSLPVVPVDSAPAPGAAQLAAQEPTKP
jgi:hypothetical protein